MRTTNVNTRIQPSQTTTLIFLGVGVFNICQLEDCTALRIRQHHDLPSVGTLVYSQAPVLIIFAGASYRFVNSRRQNRQEAGQLLSINTRLDSHSPIDDQNAQSSFKLKLKITRHFVGKESYVSRKYLYIRPDSIVSQSLTIDFV